MYLLECYKNLANVIKKGKSGEKTSKYLLELRDKNQTGINEREFSPSWPALATTSAWLINTNLELNVIFKALSSKVV